MCDNSTIDKQATDDTASNGWLHILAFGTMTGEKPQRVERPRRRSSDFRVLP